MNSHLTPVQRCGMLGCAHLTKCVVSWVLVGACSVVGTDPWWKQPYACTLGSCVWLSDCMHLRCHGRGSCRGCRLCRDHLFGAVALFSLQHCARLIKPSCAGEASCDPASVRACADIEYISL